MVKPMRLSLSVLLVSADVSILNTLQIKFVLVADFSLDNFGNAEVVALVWQLVQSSLEQLYISFSPH